MSEKTLVRIGPGLGNRSNLWKIVSKKVLAKSKDTSALTPQEQERLQILTMGKDWMELVPEEWQKAYGELFDSACCREPITTRTRDQIVRDVPRTFSLYIEHARYLRLQFNGDTETRPYCEALQCVLEVACHQSYSCGYCQGMNFLAATFLLSEASCRSAFILFTYLLRQCHLEILYNPKCSSLLEYMMYYEKRLETHNPTIYAHLQAEEFPPLCYTVEWFTTCFLVSSPGELSACVIDLLLSGFDDIMIRVGLALMDHLESVILQSNAEKLQLNFKRMLLLANCVDVMYRALLIPSDNIDELSRLETMKVNTEKMDPNGEWVDTMKTCSIHAPDGGVTNAEGSTTSIESCSCPSESSTTNNNSGVLDTNSISHTSTYRHDHADHIHAHTHHQHTPTKHSSTHTAPSIDIDTGTTSHKHSRKSHSSHNTPSKPAYATHKAHAAHPHASDSYDDPDFADWNHRSVSVSAVIGDTPRSRKSNNFRPLSRTLSGIFSSSKKKT